MNLILERELIQRRTYQNRRKINLILNRELIQRRTFKNRTPRNLIRARGFLAKNIFHGGNAYFSGQAEGIVTVSSVPAKREILVIADREKKIIKSIWSNNQGEYFINNLDPQQKYLLIARDYKNQFAPFAWDYRVPAQDLNVAEQVKIMRQQGKIVITCEQ